MPTKTNPLRYFSGLGASFVLLPAKSKTPTERAWQLRGHSLEEAKSWVARGGNVGLLAGAPSKGLVWLDVDKGFRDFCERFPKLATTPMVTRPNAPDRGRLLFRMVGQLPPNRSYTPPGEKHPVLELLARGRQGVIPPSIHPSEARYELRNGHAPLELTISELASLWRFLTGKELVRRQKAAKPKRKEPNAGDLVSQLKAAFPSALGVFDYFGLADQVEPESDGQWRLRDNGGLIVGEGEDAWRWFNFTDWVGGDQLDAWGYCRHGVHWSRYDKGMFREVLEEMSAAAGISSEDTPSLTTELAATLDTLERHATTRKWENPRARETDRSAYVELIGLARKAGTLQVAASSREVAELAGMGRRTATRALHRLVDHGLIRLVEQSDGFHAAVWELTICCEATHLIPPPTGGRWVSSLRILDNDDAFLWGSKLDPSQAHPGESLGCLGGTAKSFLAVLMGENDLHMREIAGRTGMNRSTASRKAHILASLGLVTLRKVGGNVIVHLKAHWRTLLDSLRRRLTTFGRGLKRRIAHARARIGWYRRLLRHLPLRLQGCEGEIADAILRVIERRAQLELELQELRLG